MIEAGASGAGGNVTIGTESESATAMIEKAEIRKNASE
jgi:hypothetical protein